MSNNNHTSNKIIEQADILFEKNYDKERLEVWKKQMPMPKIKPVKKNRIKFWPIFAAVIITTTCFIVFQLGRPSPQEVATELIHSTQLASLDDVNLRGNESDHIKPITQSFFVAIEILRSKEADHLKATNILAEVSSIKNDYQLEAIWFKALAHITSGEFTQGKIELEKLQSQSDYQHKNVQKLLTLLSN